MSLVKNLIDMIKKDYSYILVAMITGLVLLVLMSQHDWQSRPPKEVAQEPIQSTISTKSETQQPSKTPDQEVENQEVDKTPPSSAKAGVNNLENSETLPDFAAIKDVKQKKKQFFDYLKPMIEKQNNKIKYKRALLESLLKQRRDDQSHSALWQKKLRKLAVEFSVIKSDSQKPLTEADIKQLQIRIDIIPSALVLAQAANESAWGTSRFAKQANNLFGQWCYSKGCGLVPKQRGKGQVHEVRKFNSVAESIASYMKNLNTHRAYADLRNIRAELRQRGQRIQAQKLAQGLNHYSERGQDYVDELIQMIRYNKLE